MMAGGWRNNSKSKSNKQEKLKVLLYIIYNKSVCISYIDPSLHKATDGFLLIYAYPPPPSKLCCTLILKQPLSPAILRTCLPNPDPETKIGLTIQRLRFSQKKWGKKAEEKSLPHHPFIPHPTHSQTRICMDV